MKWFVIWLVLLSTVDVYAQLPNGPTPIAFPIIAAITEFQLNDGDSLSNQSGTTQTGDTFQDYALTSSSKPQILGYNTAIAGETLATMVANFSTQVQPLYTACCSSSSKPFIVIIMGGANDIRAGTAVATIYASLQSYVNKVHALGSNAKVLVASYPVQCDIFNTPSWLSELQTFNGDIIGNWNVTQGSGGLAADGLFNLWANTTIGPNNYSSSAFCSTTYSPDGQHMTSLAKIIAGSVQAGVMAPFLP